jgi:hypothetical protein
MKFFGGSKKADKPTGFFPHEHTAISADTEANGTIEPVMDLSAPSPNISRHTSDLAKRPIMPVLKIDFLLPKGLKYHVFLTHGSEKDEKTGWDTVERVSRVNASLRDLGFSTRFDGERMAKGSQNETSTVIDESAVVIVFVTKEYLSKVSGSDPNDSCKKEFEFAERRKGANYIIPVVMESEVQNSKNWPGPVGFACGGHLNVDMSEMDNQVCH